MNDMRDNWLIRLRDCENEHNIIAAYYTTNPDAQLKVFYTCKEYDIPISLPKFEVEKEYQSFELGSIDDIEVYFGTKTSYCCMDIWLKDIC